MKTLIALFFTLFIVAATAAAQTNTASPDFVSTNTADAKISYSVVEKGANYRVLQQTNSPTNKTAPGARPAHRYVELQTGMHYLKDNEWLPADAKIEITSQGGVSTHTRHMVTFAPDINTPGATDLTAPDGKRLRTHILGISYFDYSTGKSALIAELQNSEGQLLPSETEVLYTNAFTDVNADVLYRNAKSGVEQFIIFRSQLPPVSDRGMNPKTTTVQVMTEFLDPPTPQMVAVRSVSGRTDERLDFGEMKMGTGKAFMVGEERKGILVTKQWATIDQRTFLIEEIGFEIMQAKLAALSGQSPPKKSAALTAPRQASVKRVLPALSKIAPTGGHLRRASTPAARKGFAWDYSVGETDTNFTFRSDSTYLISGEADFSGVTTFEGLAVIKFDVNGLGLISCYDTVVSDTGPYRPAVFTAMDDDTIGEPIDGSSGTPGRDYANTALLLNGTSADLGYLRFAYAYGGIYYASSPSPCQLRHCQFIACTYPIVGEACTVNAGNLLVSGADAAVCGDSTAIFNVEHLSAVSCNNATTDFGIGDCSLNLTNSLLVNVTNWGNFVITTNYVGTNASPSAVFQQVGGGSYYLASDSPYRNAGTTNINILADLRQTTTSPPLVYSNATIASDVTLGPVAQRDTDAPDLGYHYTPLDYAFGGTTANGNVTFTPGTAVGWFRTDSGWEHAGHGLHMADAKTVTFDGNLGAYDYWVRANVVQEACDGLWDGGYGPGGITGWAWPNITDSAQIVARFTRFAMFPNDYNHYRDDWGWLIVNATHCEYFSGSAGFYNGGHHYTNCLFSRCPIGLGTDHAPSSFSMRNTTMYGGVLSPNRSGDGTNAPVVIRESAFDGTSISTTGDGTVFYGYNAFLTNADRTTPTNSHDQVVASFGWETGPLGKFYLPTNSSLINTGGVTADLIGLYHFTTTTNLSGGFELKETNSVVDIGYHFVATDANGNPTDSDSDGTPDYIEDSSGNGLVDSGETDWRSASDLGLKVLITKPKNNSSIP